MREDLTCSRRVKCKWHGTRAVTSSRQTGVAFTRAWGEARQLLQRAGASFFTDSGCGPGNGRIFGFKNGKNPPQSTGCSRCDRWDLVNDCDQLLREPVYIYFCRVTNDQRERKTAANALLIGCHQSNKSVGSLFSHKQPYVGKFSCWNLGWPRRFVPRLRNVYRFCFLTNNI